MMPEESNWLSSLNLPKILAGRFGDAVSRLLGAPISAAAARAERLEKNIEAKTAGQVVFQEMLAKAAAERAISDPEIVNRAMNRFGRDLIQQQDNLESVIEESAGILADSKGDEVSQDGEIEQDWLDRFNSLASDASSDRMRKQFAQVLAGEVRSPGSYSFRTMRLLSDLDLTTANLIKRYMTHNIGGSLILYPSGTTKKGGVSSDFFELENLGLLKGATGGLNKTLKVQNMVNAKPSLILIPYLHSRLSLTIKADVKEINLPAVPFTKSGLEILSLLELKSSQEMIAHFKEISSDIL